MRTIFSILTIVFCILKGFSQYEIIIEAKVLDRISNQPISYVNIGFVDEAVGTVSDAKGNFTLIYNEEEIDDNTLLRFSALGYKPLEIKEEQLMDYFKRSNIVYLIPTPLELDEITVSNEKRSTKTIGINTLNQGTVGYWKDKEALGGEIATLIKISQKDTKLLQLSFSVVENVSDSIKVRVNVYEFKKAYPGEKVLLQNVYKVIDEKEGVVNINLEPYNIHVNDDIIISLELLEVYGEEIGFAISGNTDYGPSYIRYISQDDWEKYRYQEINYALSVSYPVKGGKDQQIERKPPDRVTVYWDVSAYKDNSETAKEIELLKDYLQALEAVKVEVVKFNNIIQDRKVFQITQGDANDLIQYIQSSEYEGFPNYSLLLQDNPFESQYILLFTDGKDPFFQLESNIYVPVFPVSSTRDADHLELQKVSRYTDGYYINLSELKKKEALDFLLYEFEDPRDFSKTAKSSMVSGKVKMDTIPMQGVRVGVKGTLREVTTDSEGYFQINANQGETLTFEALGTFPKEVVVQNTSSIDVQLESEGEILDQVTLEARKREEELNIGQGNRRGVKSLGFGVSTLDDQDLFARYTNLGDLLRGRFAGIRVVGFNDEVKVYIERALGMSLQDSPSAIFDIDGMIYTDLPPVNIIDIESITIIRSIVGTNKYGLQGRGGVVVINTKTFGRGDPEERLRSLYATGNDFDERLPIYEDVKSVPLYLTVLQRANSFDEAKRLYRQQKEIFSRDIDFYLNSAEYFTKWNQYYALSILGEVMSFSDNNVKVLKAVAFKLDQLEYFSYATKVYEKIKELRPKEAQSYRDLALSYVKSGQYEKSMQYYRKILGREFKQVDFTELEPIISSELKHLLTNHRRKVDYEGIPNDYLSANFEEDFRIVIEWTDPLAEFEFQFVDPSQKYFTWTHSKFEDKQQLQDEIEDGIYSKQFTIEPTDYGKWMINFKRLELDKNALVDTYIKVTIFENYGKKDEKSQTMLLNLRDLDQKFILSQIYNNVEARPVERN